MSDDKIDSPEGNVREADVGASDETRITIPEPPVAAGQKPAAKKPLTHEQKVAILKERERRKQAAIAAQRAQIDAEGEPAAKKLSPEEQAKLLEAKKAAALKAAREAQRKRLQQEALKAKAAQDSAARQASNPAPGSNSETVDDGDKTRMAIPARPAAPESDDDGDKTRFAPRKTASSGAASTASPDEDLSNKTQFKSTARQSSDDATRFQPRITQEMKALADDALQTALSETRIQPVEGADEPTVKGQSAVLKDRFILEDVLGAGGMGVVYKAKDLLKVQAEDRDPYVAIKVLGEEFKSHPEAFIALQRESRKTQRIAHPNIVNVHDFDKDGDTVFMTMEFLSGQPLDKLIKQYKNTGLAPDDAEKILEGICSALAYAHEQDIIHSDLKPGNIFVTDQNVVKVFDFGIARAVASADTTQDDKEDKTVFDAGNLGALTPAYASLEMLEGEEPDIRDDIYALGCIAYELFAGAHPFNRVNAKEASAQGLKPKRIEGLPKRKWLVIQKALSFSRDERVAAADQLWNEYTTKRSNTVSIISLLAVMLVAVIGYVVLNPQEVEVVQVDESKIRNELEYKIRLETLQTGISALLASPAFDERWEGSLFSDLTETAELLSADDEWVVDARAKAYSAYLSHINSQVETQQFDVAQHFLDNARKYTQDQQELDALSLHIDTLIQEAAARAEEERIAKEAAAAKARKLKALRADKVKSREAFNVALSNVNNQLACRTQLDMRDIDIAVGKLKSLDSARYRKLESGMIDDLAACIKQIGKNFPERAEEAKKVALRTFKGHKLIRAIKITPRDPCDLSLAGFGARGNRAVCYDTVAGTGKSPAMVVIPKKGSVKAFAIGKYEVTIKEFSQYCADTKACKEITSGDTALPMTNIPLKQVQGYANWLSEKTGKVYRLPKKSEWLHAATATGVKVNPNRKCLLNTRGIQIGGSLVKARIGDPNAWGLHNIVGNASEWVNIRAGRVAAVGGSYDTPMEECSIKTAERSDGSADVHIGFRLVRELVLD